MMSETDQLQSADHPVSLAVEVSIAELVNPDADNIPALPLLEEWATTAYSEAMKHSSEADIQTNVVTSVFEHQHAALVCLRITDSEEIQQLNYQFRDKNQPTNVLSFPMQAIDGMIFDESDLMMLGDIALCAEVINHEVLVQHKTMHAHWAHMVVHGVLHLLGYDHIEEEQAQQMEQLETYILNELGFSDPYQ